jgi:hypothetical protein
MQLQAAAAAATAQEQLKHKLQAQTQVLLLQQRQKAVRNPHRQTAAAGQHIQRKTTVKAATCR